MTYADIVIIGGGPAGLAAAVRARELGVERVVIIERDSALGGILRQCIHDGFGLHRFGKQLSGCSYAQTFIDEVEKGGIEVLCDAMVLSVDADKKVTAVCPQRGVVEFSAGAVILAMGCRERTRPQVRIVGTRPAGVMTAGSVQRYINVEGWAPGKRAVILGSGDIGLIMARRMTLEGIEVEGVYEVMPILGGLRRNKAQCLDDYGIPLHLATTVVRVSGKKRVESVTVAKVDEKTRLTIPGTEREIPCDLLVLSVGLIPENELSRAAGIELHPVTKGPVTDDRMMTGVPGIFAAGNVAAVFDLVDYVSKTGELAAEGAAQYLSDGGAKYECADVEAGENVSFVFPQKLRKGGCKKELFLRVRKTIRDAEATVRCGDEVLYKKKLRFACPPEMVALEFEADTPERGAVTVDVK